MKKHNLAIIGYGGMGSWHHSSITDNISQIDVKGVYDTRAEALEKAMEKGLIVYESLNDLLNDGEIDLVTIATPNNFHKELVIKSLNRGKNVVCEKPVALNSDELIEMMDAAKKSGRLFSVHQNRRWDKDYKTIKKVIEDGTIGSPYYIESRVQGSRGSLHGWRSHKVNGGGMVLDWCAHLVDQLLMMIDSPVISVDAYLLELFSKVDDNVRVMLRFENNVLAIIDISTNCFINLPRWHISASDGTIQIDDWDAKGKIIKLNTDKQMEWADEIVYTAAGPTRTMAPRPKQTTQEIELPEIETEWSDFYKNIVNAIDGKEELFVKPEQVLRTMKVIDAIFESARLKKSISVNI